MRKTNNNNSAGRGRGADGSPAPVVRNKGRTQPIRYMNMGSLTGRKNTSNKWNKGTEERIFGSKSKPKKKPKKAVRQYTHPGQEQPSIDLCKANAVWE